MLATREVIARRTLGDPSCKICGDSLDTLRHALFRCKLAKAVWKASGWHTYMETTHSASFYDFMFQLFASKTNEEVLEFSLLAWNLWTARNKAIHEQISPVISSIINSSMSLLQTIVQNPVKHSSSSTHHHTQLPGTDSHLSPRVSVFF